MGARKETGKLLEGPIRSTLVRFSAPFILTSLLTTVYTLTDLFWIGRLGSDAVAAVGLVGYMTWLGDSVAVGMMTGLGVLVAQKVGARETPSAIVNALSAGFQVAGLAALGYVVLAFLGVNAFAALFDLGAGITQAATAYGRIIFFGMLFKMLHFSYSQAFQSFGESRLPFRINFIGLIANMVLDPLLIFGIGPMPALGMTGAAIATVSAQIIVFFVFHLVAKNQDARRMPDEIHPGLIAQFRFFGRPHLPLMGRVVKIGFPVLCLSAAFCVISIVMNRLISSFGALAVAVMTIGSQVESINWMTTEGFSAALTAMLAQNIGAARKETPRRERVDAIIHFALLLTTAFGIGVMALLFLSSSFLFGAFLPGNVAALELGRWYLLIFCVSQPFMAIEAASAGSFNAFGRTLPPAVISIGFNLLRIPLGLLFMRSFGAQGIWMGMSFTSVLKGSILTVLLRRHRQKYLQTGVENGALG